MELAVYRETPQGLIKIGSLRKHDSEIGFSYDHAYIQSPLAAAISLSLPLRKEPFREVELEPYFRGLLPEGLALESLCTTLGIRPDDYFELLAACGLDCLGDVIINPTAYQETRSYEPLTFEYLKSLGNDSIAIDTSLENARLSLAGTLSKCGLFHDPTTDIEHGWYQPFGGAPSNYIVKFAHKQLRNLMEIEYLSMTCAKSCGLSVASVSLINPGQPTLCVERYDRLSSSKEYIGRLLAPTRRHQEDLTQAFGLLPNEKYCELKPSSIEAVAVFLRAKSAQPVLDLKRFTKLILFNYLIGNCDNHLKNLSILYTPDWRAFSLAPAYDLVSTTYFPRFSREMGMVIGEHVNINEVTPKDFQLLADQLGISFRTVRTLSKELTKSVVLNLRQESERLARQGFENAPYIVDDMEEDILPRIEVLKGSL